MKKPILLLLFATISISLFAQEKKKSFFPQVAYPTDYISPVKIPVSLAGNFGECRPNHFHSGLDVRTEQRENLDLYAIQKGYVAKITISHTGFGTCMYINHPGGITSVYAHCNTFYDRLWNYLDRKQYANEKWDVSMNFPPHLFPIKQGQFIAKSGNTGSSYAPHLHMEIRETKTDKTLNGLLFYKKMKDVKKPIINRVAVYDGNKSIYNQEPRIYRAVKNGDHDVPTQRIIKTNTDKVYFGIQANDYMENSLRLGVFKMKLIVDGKALFGWQLNRISYAETRYMNAIGDYKTRMSKGFWLQLCHKLPNDKLGIYVSGTQEDGLVDVSDGKLHNVIIRVYDVKGNYKDVKFQVQGQAQKTEDKKTHPAAQFMKAGKKNTLKKHYMELALDKNQLYDNVYFKGFIDKNRLPYSHLYMVHDASVPVHEAFDVKLKPKKTIPENLQSKVAVIFTPDFEVDMEKVDGLPATYKDGWVVANIKRFGNYMIVIDQSPPAIIPYFKNGTKVSKGSRLKFGAEDNLTPLKEVRMEVAGQWLKCLRRKNNYYYKVDDKFPIGEHEVSIKAVDANDNVTIKKIKVRR